MHPQGRTCHEQGRRGILQAPSFRPCVQIAQTGTTLLLGRWGHCAKTNPPAQWSVAVWVFWANRVLSGCPVSGIRVSGCPVKTPTRLLGITARLQFQESPLVYRM